MITETELAAIDAKLEERRRIVDAMWDGGWSMDAINHAMRNAEGIPCPDYCATCRNARAHADCLGCPEC
ncbi:hypothetical protein [Streptomyces erythrochromogenes]|uniref:hypothetical protein n=1 Tax=Streptomyces erythrochromogenes TaxID=285574 RepID=UPI0037D397C2